MKHNRKPRHSPLAMAEKKLRQERTRLRRWERDLRRWEAKLHLQTVFFVDMMAQAGDKALALHRKQQGAIMAQAHRALASGRTPSFLVGNPQQSTIER